MGSKRTEKPIGSTWTHEQWLAIAERDSHLLVAAAAGSGKTAVLVERIIRRISEGSEPIDVDRLLVATFTKAAADEMRGRIREALERRLEEQPGHEHLRRQLAFIHRASITTLHSFCMEVIQRHYQLAGLYPNFRIGNETETELIRREVMEALFESHYTDSEPDSDFWRLVDAYSGERSDEPLYRLVEQLYEYSRSHPWPEAWLQSMADAFDGDGRVWQHSLQQDVRLELASVQQLLLEAGKLAQSPGGPEPYAETLQAEAAMVGAAMETAASGSWDALHEQMQLVSFGKLKPCKGADKQLQEQAKSLRDQAKKSLAALAVECFGRTPDEHREDCRRTAPLMQELVRLVVRFAADYEQAKQEKGLVDFSDLEHYCLRVLRAPESTPERDIPSDAAQAYRAHFEEVLLDEYQDTNQVQEAIVAMISRDAPDGNRFMVGDVKQSIYRFRLADPGLFMSKYRAYPLVEEAEGSTSEGRRIDLARNFRSRRQILEGVNFLFRQLMSEAVGEMTYDDAASLIPGASFPDTIANDLAIDVLLLSKAGIPDEPGEFADHGEAGEEADTGSGDSTDETPEEDASTAQLEARMIAMQIKRLLGEGGAPPFLVTDKKAGATRAVTYRDIVILLRATRDWSPVLIEELRLAGIPAYAELSTGYFSAGEVEIMMSLLKIIDNPYQDIPLAAVLRSAIVKLSVEDMAAIRVAGMKLPYYDAVRHYVQMEQPDPVLKEKLERFLELHALWRREARQSPVSDLLWRIYRLTGFYDSVGAMPGGIQRQANLRALYDRARQFESTSFRGLFRFLRFIERMREQGGDLGAAGAIGEQEDVVRILSIHKSKGLEFPVVFVAGMGKAFNMMDLNGSFLMHKELGFGPKRVDTDLRVSYPTMAHLAIRKRLRLETLAEELRVLYVALTRPKEKLFLLGTVRDAAKSATKWSMAAEHRELALPDGMLAGARCYLDWLGPALMRHKDANALRQLAGLPDTAPPPVLNGEPSRWNVFCGGTEGLALAAAAREARDETVMQAIYKGEPVYHLHSSLTEQVETRLAWRYPYDQATGFFSKTSVSEMKRRITAEERRAEWEDAAAIGEATASEKGSKPRFKKSLLRRPRFMEERQLTPAERGTLYHTVMQHLPLSLEPSAVRVRAWLEAEALHKRLPAYAVDAIEADSIATFLASPLADRMRSSADVRRELPFSYGIPAEQVYAASAPEVAGETILMQGVMDALFAVEGGWVLIDYKTDKLWQEDALEEVAARYELQIRLYGEAISHILGQPVKEAYLYLFDGAHTVRML